MNGGIIFKLFRDKLIKAFVLDLIQTLKNYKTLMYDQGADDSISSTVSVQSVAFYYIDARVKLWYSSKGFQKKIDKACYMDCIVNSIFFKQI